MPEYTIGRREFKELILWGTLKETLQGKAETTSKIRHE